MSDIFHDNASRSEYLLDNARFFNLATSSAVGEPWIATLNYVVKRSPLRLFWYSMAQSLHSQNIRRRAAVSGAIYLTAIPDSPLPGLDGAQFTGTAREIERNECADVHDYYYLHNFPDSRIRAQWMLPLSEFAGAGKRRFYELRLEQWWLLDLEGWRQNKEDCRIPVPLASLYVPSRPL
ncbi:pyridoxamine 5'-phosphate oxidase family protein [Sodalis sp. RH21]|uniref:pyridoxamine 5'-phosphate oxidase family protein n=1 Tax=unclassified Sodalis (in: enterobacteria) TaxID=2636512 RepID=UPI0039B387C4